MKCSVPDCDHDAEYRVILYDFYPELHDHEAVFFETDYTCPGICSMHAAENEQRAIGIRETRGFVKYPYTNQYQAQGFTIYVPIDWPTLSSKDNPLRIGSRKGKGPR